MENKISKVMVDKILARKHPASFQELSPLNDYTGMATSFGVTDLYSTGFPMLDEWLGGGFGKKDSYEDCVIWGETGVGKSTVALQFMKQAVINQVPQAWMILEDAPQDVNARFIRMFNTEEEGKRAISQMVKLRNLSTGEMTTEVCNPIMLPEDFSQEDFTLKDVYEWVTLMIYRGVKLFLLDHIQYVFDAAEEAMSSKANQEQRKFLKKLADLIRKHNATMVMVSHTKKDRFAQGMDKMYGSSAIAQTITKNIGVSRCDNYDYLQLTMYKNRHARLPMGSVYLQRYPDTVGEEHFGFCGCVNSLNDEERAI